VAVGSLSIEGGNVTGEEENAVLAAAVRAVSLHRFNWFLREESGSVYGQCIACGGPYPGHRKRPTPCPVQSAIELLKAEHWAAFGDES
jgi:hypothetical protein